jgi:hypothetical protein
MAATERQKLLITKAFDDLIKGRSSVKTSEVEKLHSEIMQICDVPNAYLKRRPYQSDPPIQHPPIEHPVFSIDERGVGITEVVGWPSLAEHLGLSIGSCRTSMSLEKGGAWHRCKNDRIFTITKIGTKLVSPSTQPPQDPPQDPNYHAPTGLRRYGVSD